jgi:cysteine desulfurase
MSTEALARRIYMDHTAGKPVDSRVKEAMLPFMASSYGNPSAIHLFSQEARKAIEEAREKIAKLINAENKETIIFTSGATESNNLAIKGVAYRNKDQGTHLITSEVEHMSVLNPCKFLTTRGFKTTFLPVDQDWMKNSRKKPL